MNRETVIRTVIAAVLIMGILWAWPHVVPLIPGLEKPAPKPAPKAPATPAEKEAKAPAAPATPAAPGAPAATAAPSMVAPAVPALVAVPAPAAPAKPVILGSASFGSSYDMEVEFDARGAVIRRLALARHDFFKTVADRHLPADEREPMTLIEPAAPFGALRMPEVRLRLKDAPDWVKLDLSDVLWNVDADLTKGNVAAFYVDIKEGAADGKPLLRVRKVLTVYSWSAPNLGEADKTPQYELRLRVEFESLDPRVEKVAYVLDGPPALPSEGGGMGSGGMGGGGRAFPPQAAYGKWDVGKARVTASSILGSAIKKAEDAPADAPVVQNLAGSDIAWVGQADKYFAVILIPREPSVAGTFAAGAEAYPYAVKGGDPKAPNAAVRLLSKELTLEPGKAVVNEYAIFAGPKDPDYLEQFYAALALDKLIQWGSCCGIPGIDTLSRLLVVVLAALHSVVANYGLAIVLLVIVLRAILFPVSRWSAKSMAEMQKMAPKMQEIREKYKDDQKKMQEELSKMGGLKSMGGCLPMFVQMPIWIALYGALGAAVHLRHAAFLPSAWVPQGSLFLQDLSAPDALAHWTTPFFLPGHDLPLLGYVVGWIQGMLSGGPTIGLTSFNVLPVLMSVLMFLQQRLTPQAAASSPQAAQQKQMMYFMTVFFALVLYSAPSGLCLYILTSSLLGIFEQRHFKKQLAAADAKAPEAPKDGPKVLAMPSAEKKSRLAVREKTFPERIREWVEKTFETKGRK